MMTWSLTLGLGRPRLLLLAPLRWVPGASWPLWGGGAPPLGVGAEGVVPPSPPLAAPPRGLGTRFDDPEAEIWEYEEEDF